MHTHNNLSSNTNKTNPWAHFCLFDKKRKKSSISKEKNNHLKWFEKENIDRNRLKEYLEDFFVE